MRAYLAWVVVMTAGMSTAACGPDSNPAPEAGGTGGASGGSGATGGSGGSTGGSAGTGGSSGGGAGAGTGGSTGGGAGASAGTGGGAGSGQGGSSGMAGSGGGVVVEPHGIVQYGTIFHYPGQGATYSLTQAQFYRRRQAGSTGPICQQTQVGPCSVTDCRVMTDPPEPEPPDPDPLPAPDAGVLTLRSTGTFTADLTPDGTGIYVASGVAGSLVGEESVTVTAAGGEVPAFTHTMTYPLLMLLTQPAFDDVQTEYAVSRADDLVLRWDRGSAALRIQVQSQGSTAQLGCLLEGEAGTATIPEELLGMLDQGAELVLLGVQTERVTAGEYEVSVSSAGAVMTPDRTRRAKLVLQ